MGVIRASGLASGLDTNAIVDQLVVAAKQPINQLQVNLHKVGLKKSLYQDISNDLTGMRNTLFNLRLFSTFNDKSASVSSGSILSARADSTAAAGSYSIEVKQLAKKSVMTSSFTRVRLTAQGAGVSGISGYTSAYNQLEGLHKVTIDNTGGNAVAKTAFKSYDNRSFDKYTGVAIDSALINTDGSLSRSITDADIDFSFEVNGKTINISGLSATDNIHELTGQMEVAANKALDNAFGSSMQQRLAFRAEFDGADWKLAVYNTTNEAFSSFSITAGAVLGTELGLSGTISQNSTQEIVQHNVALDYATLTTQLASAKTGLIYGVATTYDSGMTAGSFEIVQDASANLRKATKTTLAGTEAFTGAVAHTTALSSIFSAAELTRLNGTLSINNTTITISDAATKTVGDILAIVNGSGAGVTMSYDEGTRSFKLAANATGASDISLSSGTSAILEAFALTAGRGATKTLGSTEGALDTSSVISSAGFTELPNSGIFSINGVPIYVDASKDSVDGLIRKVNNSAAGVTMTYDKNQDKFIITGKPGERITLGSPNDTSRILQSMGLTHKFDAELALGDAGQNAIFTIDGRTYQRGENSVNDVIAGLSLNLTSAGITTVEVGINTDTAVDALAAFIKSYNEMMLKLSPSDISREDRRNKMEPLGEQDKAAMSSEEIKKYEEEYDALHKTDMLLKERELKQLKQALRSNIMNVVEGGSSKFRSLTDLGFKIAGDGDITITQKGFLMVASTDLDEIKNSIRNNSVVMGNLRTNSEEVFRFFGDYDETTVSGKTVVNRDSWARRYERLIINQQDIEGPLGLKTRTNGALDKQAANLTNQIDRKNRSLESYLERLWAQFTAMETRISSIQNQAQYISQLSNMTNSNNNK